jgi:hypothetical protein
MAFHDAKTAMICPESRQQDVKRRILQRRPI